MMQKSWHVPEISNKRIKDICHNYALSRLSAIILSNRKLPLEDIEDFLKPRLKNLTDPFLIPGIETAVIRIWKAIHDKERILIFGDYDTDGVTSTALLSWVLRWHGAKVDSYLPKRLEEGYGLTVESFEKSVNGHSLIVTVDCGITSSDAIDYANSKDIDVIVTDHHEPSKKLPNALAVINPKLHQDLENLHILAGVGVCFKLCHALIKFGREKNLIENPLDLKDGLDFVALGTVADIVPLKGENRCLVKNGLRILANQKRPGIRALIEISGIDDNLKSQDISFKLAPRINAAGRLGDAEDALDLLLTPNIVDAYPIAENLDDVNRERQSYEKAIFREVQKQLESMKLEEQSSFVLAGRNWHPGVIGIVASKLVQKYYRPIIVLSILENGELYGSGRSVEGVNLVEVLSNCRDFLSQFGGHPMAIGLRMREENFSQFKEIFEIEIKRHCAENAIKFKPVLTLEGDGLLHELNDQFFNELESFQPFGNSNPAPIFRFNNVQPRNMTAVGKEHTRGKICDNRGFQIRFIAFGWKLNDFPMTPWSVVGTPEINRYNGYCNPQIQLLDVKNVRSSEFN